MNVCKIVSNAKVKENVKNAIADRWYEGKEEYNKMSDREKKELKLRKDFEKEL